MHKSSLWSDLICVSARCPVLGKLQRMSYIIFELFQSKASVVLIRNRNHVLPSPVLRMFLDLGTNLTLY